MELVEIETEKRGELKDFLYKYWPDTLEIIHGGLKGILRAEQNPKLFAHSCLPVTTVILTFDEGIKSIYVFSTDNVKTALILDSFIQNDTILVGNEELLKQVNLEKVLPKCHLTKPFFRYIYKVEANTTSVQEVTKSVPEGYKADSIHSSDIEFVVSMWTPAAKSDKMKYRMRNYITNGSTAAVYDTTVQPNQLVSWIVSSEIGQLFHFHTLEEHRGKGLGSIVVEDITQKLLAKGITPVSYIFADNAASSIIFTKCGYEKEGSSLIHLVPDEVI